MVNIMFMIFGIYHSHFSIKPIEAGHSLPFTLRQAIRIEAHSGNSCTFLNARTARETFHNARLHSLLWNISSNLARSDTAKRPTDHIRDTWQSPTSKTNFIDNTIYFYRIRHAMQISYPGLSNGYPRRSGGLYLPWIGSVSKPLGTCFFELLGFHCVTYGFT